MFFKKMTIIGATLLSSYFLGACSQSQYNLNALQESPVTHSKIAFIAEKSATLPPYGYVQFCRDNSAECPEQYMQKPQQTVQNSETTATTAGIQPLSPFNRLYNLQRLINNHPVEKENFTSVLSLLESVNRQVNNNVMQVTDMDGFGVLENWRLPNLNKFGGDIGDCEDFALAKRKILIDTYGFNRNDVSMSVLRRPQGDVHAVLMVRTPYGDYVLDNLERDVLPWHQTGYSWLKKQSFDNPSQWISL
jgi:predicted transglutaminase-like cysteine proteinase